MLKLIKWIYYLGYEAGYRAALAHKREKARFDRAIAKEAGVIDEIAEIDEAVQDEIISNKNDSPRSI